MTFTETLNLQTELNIITEDLGNQINCFEKNELGMISFSNKEVGSIKILFDIKFKELQKVNKSLTSNFKKEYKEYRLAKRKLRYNN